MIQHLQRSFNTKVIKFRMSLQWTLLNVQVSTFLALSHKILISCATGQTEGNAANTNLTNARWMGHSLMEWWCFTVQWSAPCPESWTSPITWTHWACHRPLGSVQPLLRRPGLQSNSKVQVINRRLVSLRTLTEHERDEPWYFSKFVNIYFFHSIRLHLVSKYSFAFFWKYSFAITYSNRLHVFESIRFHVFESIRLHFFASIRLLILSNRLHVFSHIPLLLLGK